MTFAQPFKDYEILDRVGAGAMGTVFKARHKKLNRIVALKVLKPSLARDTRYVDRLRREARIVASLNHPYIVTGYDLGEEGGYHYFVMEFVEGKSLRALLVEWGMFAEEYVRRVARQVAMALDHAYQRGVIHRDIKPGNILIDEAGNVKLTDMGLAKGPADLTITRDGATVGTPQYISPEQARNPQDVDVRSDLYSLGATLYHMATGVPPFRGDTMAQLLTKLLHETPVPPDEINPALSPGLALIIRKLLAKDLRVRYQTPRELLDDLERIERALPPQVDVDRLVAASGPRSSTLVRAATVLVVAALLVLATWVGMQLRDEDPAAPSPDEFLVQLDRDLAAQPTAGARLAHLRSIASTQPGGVELAVSLRESAVKNELQRSVDDVMTELEGPRWADLQAWLREPARWPDRRRAESERIAPLLRERAGVALGHLPPQIRSSRVDEILAAVDREIAQRDRELVVRFELFLGTTLPARADERVRANDFAAADRLWRDAIATFHDGVRLPLFERLLPPVAARVEEAHRRASAEATTSIDAAESAVVAAMRAQVDAVTGDLLEALASGEDPESVAGGIARLRQELAQVWPPGARFRIGRDPWPGIEQQIGSAQQALAAALERAADRRFDARCDLVWRTYCAAGAADALAVLAHGDPPAPRHVSQNTRLREVLESTRAVEDAVLQAIGRSTQPIVAFPRTGTASAVQLQVENRDGAPQLTSRLGDQATRRARLVEFRFRDLLGQLRQQNSDPSLGVPPRQFAVGSMVVSMAADDLPGVAEALRSVDGDDGFLVDQVWPRIQRVRNERPEALLDRAALFAGLRRARDVAEKTGDLAQLDSALVACETRVPAIELTDTERASLRSSRRWLSLERRRRIVQNEVVTAAPRGAEVAIAIDADELVGSVTMSGAMLHRDAAEGWQIRNGVLEFAGGDRPWSEMPLQALRCDPGLSAAALRTTVDLDFVVPPPNVGRRFHVVEFRGIAFVFVVAANDAAHAATIDGDPRREEAAQRAFVRAMQNALSPSRTIVVPGAVQRLTIDLVAASSRRRVAVKVMLEDAVLIDEQRDLDPDRRPEVVLYPRQELAVHRIQVRAIGL